MADDDDELGDTVELGEYLSFIKAELDNESACLELPFTIMLLLSFAMSALLHLKQDQIFSFESGVKFDIEENANFAWSHNFGHKTVFDVNSIADFWSWTRIGFMPLMIQQSWGFSEDLQTSYDALNASTPFVMSSLPGFYGQSGSMAGVLPVRNDWLHYNRFVGGMRFQQERSQRVSYDSCRIPGVIPASTWKAWLGKPCMPSDPPYELPIENGDAENYNVLSRQEWLFPFLDPLDDIRMAITDMEDGCAQLVAKNASRPCACLTCPPGLPWIDDHTQRIEIGFVVFNADYGLISLVTVNFFFNRAGHIQKYVHAQSSWSVHFDDTFFQLTGMVICDAVYMFAIARVFVTEVREICHTIKASKERFYKSVYDDYFQFWNMVDWSSIFCACLVVIMWVVLFVRTQDVNGAMSDIVTYDKSSGGRATYQELSVILMDSVETMCEVERVYRFSFCLYPMIVMMRLFKSFHAQARLAVVTRTLYLAAPGLVHFFIVFLSVYFCMAVNGVLLFGQDTVSFATLFRSVATCFRMMFGDWNWDEMKEVGREWAMLWFWLFQMIISIILLNMLLAILMDSYAEVSASVDNAQTLPEQVSEILRRHRQSKRKERVKLNDVFETYFKKIKDEKDMLECKDIISAHDLINEVDGMKMKQAKRTIKNTLNAIEGRNQTPYVQTDVASAMRVALNRMRIVKDSTSAIKEVFTSFDENAVSAADVKRASKQLHKRQALAESVVEVVEDLPAKVSMVLGEEMRIFEERTTTIKHQQAEMVKTVKDGHRLIRELRETTDTAFRSLRGHVSTQQKRVVAATPTESLGLHENCFSIRRAEA